MNIETSRIKIAAVADLHYQESGPHLSYHDVFVQVSEKAHVLALCGDLTNLGLPSEAERLASDLSACKIPVVGVLGNHDYQSGRAEEVKKILKSAHMFLLDGESCEVAGLGFAGVKGFGGGFGEHMLSSFGEDGMKAFVTEAVNECLKLEVGLRSLDLKQKVVILHYSPIAETLQGESPEIFPFLGCSRMAETIDRFEVTAVCHGHAHRGSARGKTLKGVPVYNCCLELAKHAAEHQPYVLIEIEKAVETTEAAA